MWDAATLTEIAGFNVHDQSLRGGVIVAASGGADIVTGTGAGSGPREAGPRRRRDQEKEGAWQSRSYLRSGS